MRTFGWGCWRQVVVIPVVSFLFSACATPGQGHRDAATCIKTGQVWRYDQRANDKGSELTIVEEFRDRDLKRFYIVRLSKIRIESPHFKNHFADGVPYFIVSERGLQASLKKIKGWSKWNPVFDEHYLHWKQAYKPKPVHDRRIKEILNDLESFLNIQLGA